MICHFQVQSTPDNSNLARKIKKKVRVIGSSSYREQNYVESEPKGNENCFDLADGSSYRGFELPEVDCNSFSSISTNKDA